MENRILFVDDEANVLSSYRRTLHNKFDILTMESAKEALELLKDKPRDSFSVIVSDYKMPEMSGLEFLKAAAEYSPNSVRMMLTGYADLDTSISAINEGHIFRFLTKPCPPSILVASLNAALRQFGLVMAEKELLRGTLQGSIKLMTELLSMTNPIAFGQSERIKRMVSRILKQYKISTSWTVEVAAMLSQIGCTAIPTDVVAKVDKGEKLTADEELLYNSHPEAGGHLLRNIPRLDQVADIIANQDKIEDREAPIGSRIIHLAKQYDHAICSGMPIHVLLADLRKVEHFYGPQLLDVFESIVKEEIDTTIVTLPISSLKMGMIVDQDVLTRDNLLLINKGQELTEASILRLVNYGKSCGVKEPIKVIISSEGSDND